MMKRLFNRHIKPLALFLILFMPMTAIAVEKVGVTSRAPITMSVKKQQSLSVQGATVQNAKSVSILSSRNQTLKAFTTTLSCKAPTRKGAKGSCAVKLTITKAVPLGKYTLNLLDAKRQVLAAGQFEVKADPAVARAAAVKKQQAAAKQKAVLAAKQKAAADQKRALLAKQKADAAKAAAVKQQQQAAAKQKAALATKQKAAADQKRALLARQKADTAKAAAVKQQQQAAAKQKAALATKQKAAADQKKALLAKQKADTAKAVAVKQQQQAATKQKAALATKQKSAADQKRALLTKQKADKEKAAVVKQQQQAAAKQKATLATKQKAAADQKKVLLAKQKADNEKAAVVKQQQQAAAKQKATLATKQKAAADQKKVLLAKQKADNEKAAAVKQQQQVETRKTIALTAQKKAAADQKKALLAKQKPDKEKAAAVKQQQQAAAKQKAADTPQSKVMTANDRTVSVVTQGRGSFEGTNPPSRVTAPDSTPMTAGTLSSAVTIDSYKINGGSGQTDDRNVVLYHYTTNNPTHYRVAESPSWDGPDWAQVSWIPYVPNPAYTLSVGEGVKVVYLQVKGQDLTDRFGGSQPNVITASASIRYGDSPVASNSSVENGAANAVQATSCNISYNFDDNRSTSKNIAQGSSIDINVSGINYVTNRPSSNADAKFDFAPTAFVSDITLKPGQRNPLAGAFLNKPTLEKVVCLDQNGQSGASMPTITTPLALAQALRAAGNTADYAASQMKSVLNATPSQIGAALQTAGYNIDQIAAALRSALGFSRDQVQQVLQALQYSASQIKAALDGLFGAAVSAGSQVVADVSTGLQVIAANNMVLESVFHGDDYVLGEAGLIQCTYYSGAQLFGYDFNPMPLPNNNRAMTVTIRGTYLQATSSISGLPSGATASITARGKCGIRLSIRVPESVSSEGNTTGIAILMVGNERGASFVYQIKPIPPWKSQPEIPVRWGVPGSSASTGTNTNTNAGSVDLIPMSPLAALYRHDSAVRMQNPSTKDYYTLLIPPDNSFCDGLDDIDPLEGEVSTDEKGVLKYDESSFNTSAFANISDVLPVPDIQWGVQNIGSEVSGLFTIKLEYPGREPVTKVIQSLGAGEKRTFTYQRPQSTIRVAKLTTTVIPGFNTNSDSSNCYHVGLSGDGWNDNDTYWVSVDINNEIDEPRVNGVDGETNNIFQIDPRPR